MPLVQVPFRKNRNLVHFTDFNSLRSGTCPGAAQSLVQVELSTWPSARTRPLIQVISQTDYITYQESPMSTSYYDHNAFNSPIVH